MRLRLPERARRDFSVALGPVRRELEGDQLVCVGDYVSLLCSRRGGKAILVVDGITRRSESLPSPNVHNLPQYEIANERGTLSLQAVELICKLLSAGEGALVKVEGEEDMIALAAIACLRPGWKVVYGIPGKGSCIVPYSPLTARIAQTRVLQLEP
ncbi:MAG: DUF359 domain-containing protein [Acidilobaceae archaeon]|nr:DUF359 domain-containing protein [Acidilobaceae archaeon]MDW7974358.1 DUF359 domain-containing protein [Sulfolobales archaeon]